MSGQSILMTYDLPHPPAKVWRALTEPALVAKWLMATDMQATLGQTFQFTQAPTQWWDGIVHCEVLQLELHKRLSYSWKTSGGATGLDTVVTWTLAETAKGTRLTLEHSGFAAQNKFAFDGAGVGWQRMIKQALADVLDSMRV